MKITHENIEAWMLDYVEGSLDADQTIEFEQYLEAQPEYKKEIEGFRTIVIPKDDRLVFPNKEKLYKRPERKIVPFGKWMLPMAAAASLMFFFIWQSQGKMSDYPTGGENEQVVQSDKTNPTNPQSKTIDRKNDLLVGIEKKREALAATQETTVKDNMDGNLTERSSGVLREADDNNNKSKNLADKGFTRALPNSKNSIDAKSLKKRIQKQNKQANTANLAGLEKTEKQKGNGNGKAISDVLSQESPNTELAEQPNASPNLQRRAIEEALPMQDQKDHKEQKSQQLKQEIVENQAVNQKEALDPKENPGLLPSEREQLLAIDEEIKATEEELAQIEKNKKKRILKEDFLDYMEETEGAATPEFAKGSPQETDAIRKSSKSKKKVSTKKKFFRALGDKLEKAFLPEAFSENMKSTEEEFKIISNEGN